MESAFKKIIKKIIIHIIDIMHIPFPKKYSFIILASHGTGHNALWIFLQKCHIHLIRVFMLRTSYIDFCWNIFKTLCTLKKNQQMALTFSEKNFENEQNIYSKITQKVPALMLVRDPISVLKTHVNLYRFYNHEAIMDADFKVTPPPPPYCIGFDIFKKQMIHTQAPDLHALHLWISSIDGDYSQIKKFDYIKQEDQERFLTYSCIYQSAYEKIKDKITKIHYIDMDDIMPNTVFETIKNLAQIFHFAPPKESDRIFYETKLYGIENIFFPLSLNISCLFDKNISQSQSYVHHTGSHCMLHISNPQRADYFLGFECHYDVSDLFNFHIPHSDIKVYISKTFKHSLSILSSEQIMHISQSLQDYYQWFLKQSLHIQQHKISEQDINAYLSHDHALSERLKKILDYETSLIKEQAPKLYYSWKHYQSFLQQSEKYARN